MHVYDDEYFAGRSVSPLARLSRDFLLRDLGTASRVLEIGAGAGDLARTGRSSCRQYVAVDLVRYTEMLDVQADGARLPFLNDVYDFVLSMDTIEHLMHPQDHLREVARVLRPGGTIRFTTPNADYADPSMFEDSTHISVHPVDVWRGWLLTTGFCGIKIRRTVPWLGHPKLLYSAARISRNLPIDWPNGGLIFATASLPFAET